jgi:hypothetical protein
MTVSDAGEVTLVEPLGDTEIVGAAPARRSATSVRGDADLCSEIASLALTAPAQTMRVGSAE